VNSWSITYENSQLQLHVWQRTSIWFCYSANLQFFPHSLLFIWVGQKFYSNARQVRASCNSQAKMFQNIFLIEDCDKSSININLFHMKRSSSLIFLFVCSAKKRSVGTTQKVASFSSTSNSFLNRYLMQYLLSLHYKLKDQKMWERRFHAFPHYPPGCN